MPRNGSVFGMCLFLFQSKYREEGKREISSSLYSLLPDTTEMQLSKTVKEFQSEVIPPSSSSSSSASSSHHEEERFNDRMVALVLRTWGHCINIL